MSKNEITIIAPCYNEEKNINEFYLRIKELTKINLTNYKFIFIDDGSIDTTWDIISELSKNDKNVDAIQLVKEIGHQNAISAALPFISSNFLLMLICKIHLSYYRKCIKKLKKKILILFMVKG